MIGYLTELARSTGAWTQTDLEVVEGSDLIKKRIYKLKGVQIWEFLR